jgi:hypothetical protein
VAKLGPSEVAFGFHGSEDYLVGSGDRKFLEAGFIPAFFVDFQNDSG